MKNPRIFTASVVTKEGWRDRCHFFAETEEQAKSLAEEKAKHAFGSNFDRVLEIIPPKEMPDDPKTATVFGIDSFRDDHGFQITIGRKNGTVEFCVAGSREQLQEESGWDEEGHHYDDYYFVGKCGESGYLRKIGMLILMLADDVDEFNRREERCKQIAGEKDEPSGNLD